MQDSKTTKFISRENDRELLRERAKKLASKIDVVSLESEKDENLRDYVQFSVGGNFYAFETSIVKEVLEPEEIVTVPCTPDHILGVVSVRGHICSVVDLHAFLGLPRVGSTSRKKILFLSSSDMELGIIVDEITDVFSISSVDIQPISAGGAAFDRYSLGITENRIAVLDGEKFLADPLLVVNETVGRSV